MARPLPSTPSPREQTEQPVSSLRDLTTPLGTSTQRLAFVGDVWRLAYEMPPMTYVEAMAWKSRLNRGRKELVSMRVHQPGYTVGTPGTVLVKGAGQLGSSLLVDGGTPGFQMAEGQWFSFTSGGRSYLHQITDDVVFDGSGEATLPIEPMLRVSPADNAPLEIAAPVIEGFTDVDPSWSVNVAHHVPLNFTITERA